jgi:hypothetical protein
MGWPVDHRLKTSLALSIMDSIVGFTSISQWRVWTSEALEAYQDLIRPRALVFGAPEQDTSTLEFLQGSGAETGEWRSAYEEGQCNL